MTEYKIIDKWVTPNKFSRPQTPIKELKGICIHWVAVANGRAIGVYNHFENRKHGKNDYGSAHEAIDLDGSILRLIPSNEVAYGAGASSYKAEALRGLGSYPNHYLYHIEVCHTDMTGRMTPATYETLVSRVADLCVAWKLDPQKELWRHFDITGKDCPKFFVQNPSQWEQFKSAVATRVAVILAPPAPRPEPQAEVLEGINKWQQTMGTNAVNALAREGIISDPEGWIKKLNENVPNWLFFELLRRVYIKAKN